VKRYSIGGVLEEGPVRQCRCCGERLVTFDGGRYLYDESGNRLMWADYQAASTGPTCDCPARSAGDGCHYTWCPVWVPYEARAEARP
jgi:hypothetical protein